MQKQWGEGGRIQHKPNLNVKLYEKKFHSATQKMLLVSKKNSLAKLRYDKMKALYPSRKSACPAHDRACKKYTTITMWQEQTESQQSIRGCSKML